MFYKIQQKENDSASVPRCINVLRHDRFHTEPFRADCAGADAATLGLKAGAHDRIACK